ncbi:L-threonylcarbamoyladenylate synthase [Magnetospirillum gryphiswaldense]|uniref:L-threonylcarbamoyladenylate synthase n=1 Tax=Magnetospirillum gryphiswaldense TaxID=55518 RepID=UPI000D045B22|nr:L-threonylcarbamoyladenylate synthase [Magnetospirillum gryphiswaldense]AVM74904.1 Threonylcarbamoyl-AMP synthase [Magnetospirillum gryphiswaldense MSR-1]AVM78807.1 Threonylcarbamoyl-AMP synthase [Magnetospirillum gryphiswaldense]
MSQNLTHARIEPATPLSVASAGARLRAGQLVAFATETVYGLGGDATNDHAVAAIFAAKGRPSFNPLIAHVADFDLIETLVQVDDRARALMKRFWPGPLTLVLPRAAHSPISLLASAGLDTIAIRMPDHDVARAIIRAAGRPIAAPSANRSGAVSPTTAAHVAESLGERAGLIIDGGPCRVGVESTVLDLSTPIPTLLRPGGITADQIEAVLGQKTQSAQADASAPKSPGMLESHYAPALAVRLNAEHAHAGEALLGFGAMDCTLNLSPTGDLEEAAAHLFAMMRALDRAPFTALAVAPIPEHGLGAAINDRLRRAAAPRS